MSVNDTQQQLFGAPSGNNVEIATSGREIRPLMSIPAALVDEARLRFDQDALRIRAVDPANVGMVELKAHAEAFEAYGLSDEEFAAGVNLGLLQKQLRNARMGKSTDDPIQLDVDGTRTLVTTEREYDLTTLTQTNEVLNIDPGAIREDPELPGLSLPCEATIDVPAFADAVESVNRVSDHLVVTERDDELVLAGRGGDDNTGEYGTVANFGDVVEVRDDEEYEGGEVSVLSLDYVRNYAEALKDGKVDDVTLAWGQELPVRMEFERTQDEETLYEGQFFQAPRIDG